MRRVIAAFARNTVFANIVLAMIFVAGGFAVRQMVRELNLPLEIIAGPIKREADGLAMSSRNNYLNPANREKSRILSKALSQCCEQIRQGGDIGQALRNGMQLLENNGFLVDYLTLRRARDLEKVQPGDLETGSELVMLAAASIGGTRLIDNMKFTLPASA